MTDHLSFVNLAKCTSRDFSYKDVEARKGGKPQHNNRNSGESIFIRRTVDILVSMLSAGCSLNAAQIVCLSNALDTDGRHSLRS